MRGKRAKKRELYKDPKYGNLVIGRLVNKVMLHGKKTVAEDLVYSAIENGAKKVKADEVEFVEKAIDNVRPALEIRARRVGGANYSIPVPVTPRRQEALAVRWIVDSARNKQGKSFDNILADALIDAYKGEGEAIKKKIDVEKMAEANKAFAHFRW
jgi:small subunit ribosomal protein S7